MCWISNNIFEILKIVIAIIGGALALIQFNRKSKFDRISNLSLVWRAFYQDKELLDVFTAFDKVATHPENEEYANYLKELDRAVKMKFLALLAEVHVFAIVSATDKKAALRLFAWHFRYVFTYEASKYHFWDNLVENDATLEAHKERIDAELIQPYWKVYYDFAKDAEDKNKKAGYV